MTGSPDTLAALESAVRPVLLGARDAYFNLLTYSAIAVGVGVVLEGVELAKDWREECRWLQRIRLPLPHAGLWILTAASFGWLLVAVGVFGEFWFEDRVSWYDHTIRSIDDDAERLLSTQTANTQLLTAELNKRAEDEATARVTVEKEAAALRKEAASLLRDVANANAMADEARSMAKSAELARAQLEARIAPRTLTVAQREFMARSFRPFVRNFFGRKVNFDWQSPDTEAAIFALEIEDALKRAAIQFQGGGGLRVGGISIGVTITGASADGGFVRTLATLLGQQIT
jgi:hypothetical protein